MPASAGAGERVSIPPVAGAGGDAIPATLAMPDGPGPFPAVVVAHDCSGLGARSSGAPARWARELNGRGYATIIPDSFSTRGFPDGVCTNAAPGRTSVSPPNRAHDVYATLRFLRGLPNVDGARVGLMGGSHGGSTTLAALQAPDDDTSPLAMEKRAGFAAGVALYPSCGPGARTWHSTSGVYRPAAPVYILAGASDDWTPASYCQALADASRAAGHPVSLKIYSGAHHAFDSDRPIRFVAGRINVHAPGGRGATTGGDPAAWADSIKEVLAYFDRHLKAGR